MDTTSEVETVTVTSTGDADLEVTGVGLSGVDSGKFAVASEDCTGGSHAKDETCVISLTFTPDSAGGKSATLEITHNASSSPDTVALSGTGVDPPSEPVAEVDRSEVPFGDQTVDTTSGEEMVTVTSTGDADLEVTGVALAEDADFDEFAVASEDCTGESHAKDEACDISLTFTPDSAGAKSATLEITHNASTSPDTVALSGTGVESSEPGAAVDRSEVPFGEQTVGTTSGEEMVTVTSTGDADLEVTGVALAEDADFDEFAVASEDCTGGSHAKDETCVISLTFTPDSAGAKSATLEITHNASTSPDTVALSGTGVEPPEPGADVDRTEVDFGDQTVDTTSDAQSVTVASTGDADLEITGVGLTGANSDEFSVDEEDCEGATLAAGEDCDISLTFTPTSTGAKTGELEITHNASTSPDTVALSGEGTAPPPPPPPPTQEEDEDTPPSPAPQPSPDPPATTESSTPSIALCDRALSGIRGAIDSFRLGKRAMSLAVRNYRFAVRTFRRSSDPRTRRAARAHAGRSVRYYRLGRRVASAALSEAFAQHRIVRRC